MFDIELACHTSPWGVKGIINSLDDIEKAGFHGIEMPTEIVEQFEDRIGVFTEILSQHKLQLIAITGGGAMWPGMNLDEEVERSLNVARFLKACGAKTLVLTPPRPNPDSPIEDELDLVPAATAYGEIARRTLELEIQTCLHPEAGSCVDTPKLTQKFLQMADPEAMKLCIDSGFLFEAGVPIESFIKEYRKKIGIVHLRDLKPRDKKSKPKKGKELSKMQAVELGKGQVDLQTFVDALLDVDFTGWATVEFDAMGSAHATLEAAKNCRKYAEHTLDLVL